MNMMNSGLENNLTVADVHDSQHVVFYSNKF